MPKRYTQTPIARACDVASAEVYHAAERPGYACWCALWTDEPGAVYLAFAEKRRAPNPLWQPVPLDFWESMGLPVKYHTSFCNGSRDVVTELVVLKSIDNATTWTEIGRSPSRVINAFSWASLPDGSIIRVISDDYVAFDPAYEPELRAEVSRDGGNTWELRSVLLKGYHAYGYRLKRLRDGTLVQRAGYSEGFGPGRARQTRHTKRSFVRQERTCGVFISTDDGKSWSPPLTAFPGIDGAGESDFVELPDGDLLFVNSPDSGPQVRQKFRRAGNGFTPGPVFDIVSGVSPETLVQTRSGLLVGALRYVGTEDSGICTCSNDEGATWHRIEDVPRVNYQPYMVELADGRLLCAWHIGGDCFFGEMDQWVGTHRFRVEAELPPPATLNLTRDTDPDGTKYINSYTATLSLNGRPLPGRTVSFGYHQRGSDDAAKSRDPRTTGTVVTAATDEQGRARLDLGQFDELTYMHEWYRVTAWFDPDADEPWLASVRSEVYFAYTQTMTATELGG